MVCCMALLAPAARPCPPQELEELRARRDALRKKVEACSELEKVLIDHSRSLLDALAMWESSARELRLGGEAGA